MTHICLQRGQPNIRQFVSHDRTPYILSSWIKAGKVDARSTWIKIFLLTRVASTGVIGLKISRGKTKYWYGTRERLNDLSFTQNIVHACSTFYPYEGYRSVAPLDAVRVNRTIFHTGHTI